MSEDNKDQVSSISNARSPEEVGEYWDSHSLADHWDQTHEVEFEIRAPHRITLDPEVYARLEEQATADDAARPGRIAERSPAQPI